MGYTFVLGLILLSGATLGLQLRLYFCMIGGNKFLQAVDNKQEELLCRAMGLNYERIKAVHDGISPMDTPLTSKFEQMYRTWSTAKPQQWLTIENYYKIANVYFVSSPQICAMC